MKSLSALFAGLLFGLGLAASGMTNTAKVIGFLDIFGAWDPDLLIVMGAAVVTAAIGFAIVLKRPASLFGGVFSLPTSTIIDRRLIGGASLFGLGWGLYGYCPGPAIAAIGYGAPATFLFIFTMLVGMAVADRVFN